MQNTQKVSHLLWTRCRDIALASAVHPFILSLLRGTLTECAFKSYIAQDAFYLQSFKRAYGRAYNLCHLSNDDMGKSYFARLSCGVDTELQIHAEFSKKLNINLDTVAPFPQTELYTEFLDKSGSQSIAHICASMTPCMALYAFIGRRGVQNGYKPGIYSRWLDEYSSENFQELTRSLEEMLDHYAEKEGIEYSSLLPSYQTAMELELAFFSAHEIRSWNGIKPSLLFIDFDNTLTAKDTISLLTTNTLACQNKSNEIFKNLEIQYMEKYNSFIQTHTNVKSSEFQIDSFKSMIYNLSRFDESMLPPVEDSKLLSGMPKSELVKLGQRVELFPYARETLNFMLRRVPVHIITLNWCRTLVETALESSIPHTPNNNNDNKNKLIIHSNELEMDENEISTGNIIKNLNTAEDKEKRIQNILYEHNKSSTTTTTATNTKLSKKSSNSSSSPSSFISTTVTSAVSGPSVYIGDSVADLAAMLAVDIGIVLCPRTSFRNICESVGIQMKPLEDIIQYNDKTTTTDNDSNSNINNSSNNNGIDILAKKKKDTGVIYVAESWAHIGFCLYGRHFYSEWLASHHFKYFPLSPSPSPSSHSSTSATTTTTTSTSTLPRVITVAGSDSGGGAGIQADLKTFDALGVFGTTAITALTSQNTIEVTAVINTPPSHVRTQIEAVASDIGVDAIKTGMLPDENYASEILKCMISHGIPNFVMDPVMVTTSGTRLMSEEAVAGIRRRLFPAALVVTPNLEEVRVLLNCNPITTVQEMEWAAERIFDMGPGYVLIKGGHMVLNTVDDNIDDGSHTTTAAAYVTDVLYDGFTFEHIRHPVVSTSNTHGTGCTLASAIASHLSRGHDVPTAIHRARSYLQETLRRSANLKLGRGKHGPMFHMAPLLPRALGAMRGKGFLGEMWRLDPNQFSLRAYVVTDPSLNEKYGRSMEEAVAAAVAGGASVIQLREKRASSSAFIATARNVLAITRAANIPLLINDRVDVALAVGADGVHLGQDDMSVADARAILGPSCIIGVSTRNVEEALKAHTDGADYIGVGAIYPTATKTDTKHIGLEHLRTISSAVGIPVVAIGGIGLGAQVGDCLRHGASGIAIVSAVFGVEDIKSATEQLVSDIEMFYPDSQH